MVWGLNNFVNSSIFGENWYKAKTGGAVYKTAKSCVLWEKGWADTLESGYIMATEYRKEGEKNFTRSTGRISANKYHNIYRFSQGQGALLHMLCTCESFAIIHNTPCVPKHSYYWLGERKERKKERKKESNIFTRWIKKSIQIREQTFQLWIVKYTSYLLHGPKQSPPPFPQPGGRGGWLSRQEHTEGSCWQLLMFLIFIKKAEWQSSKLSTSEWTL